MADVDPIQFGKLLAAVESLTDEMAETRKEMTLLRSRISELESHWHWGKGAFAAAAVVIPLAIGVVLFGATKTIKAWLGL